MPTLFVSRCLSRHLEIDGELHFKDAFSIIKVPEENVYNVFYIAGFIPVLRHYFRIRAAGKVHQVEAEIYAHALNELNAFMFHEGIEQKQRQKLLRDLKVCEMLIRMLQAPFSYQKGSDSPLVEPLLRNQSASAIKEYNDVTKSGNEATYLVMNAVFRVLRSLLAGNSRKNELYMARHVPFLWDMFGTAMKVEPMFNELFRDNREIIDLVGSEEIAKVIAQLEEDKNADYLEFLSVLCVCEGAPIVYHQSTVGKNLLGQKKPPVYLTEVNQKLDGIDVTLKGDWKDRQSLADFALSALDEDETTSTPQFLFLQRQLELYGNLCLGRHEDNIR